MTYEFYNISNPTVLTNLKTFCGWRLVNFKRTFWYPQFSQKTNENNSTWGIIVVKSIFFVLFLGELKIPKRHFEINLPLALGSINSEGACRISKYKNFLDPFEPFYNFVYFFFSSCTKIFDNKLQNSEWIKTTLIVSIWSPWILNWEGLECF